MSRKENLGWPNQPNHECTAYRIYEIDPRPSHIYFRCETLTRHLHSFPPGETSYGVILGVLEFNVRAKIRVSGLFFSRVWLFVTPSWPATKMAKQLSTATAPLCFGFFRCALMSCKVNFHVVRSALCRIQRVYWLWCSPFIFPGVL